MKYLFFIFMCVNIFADSHKVLLDVNTGNPKVFEKELLSKVSQIHSYYASEGNKVKIVVLISGNAYKFFLKDTEHTLYGLNKNFTELREDIQSRLRRFSSEYDIIFLACEKGMQRRNLKTEQLLDFVLLSYSHTIALISWQNKGYAYIPTQ